MISLGLWRVIEVVVIRTVKLIADPISAHARKAYARATFWANSQLHKAQHPLSVTDSAAIVQCDL